MLRLWFLVILACAGALAPSRACARMAETRAEVFLLQLQDSRPESAAQVADSHLANPLHGYDFVSGCCLAAETAPGRVFWSGRQGANRAAAEAHAAATGQTTLEMTATGRALEAQGAGIDAWRAASADFARGAAGDVTAFAGKSAPGSVWRTVELPLLKQNPEVTRIIIKDAVNPSTTTIIYPR